MAKKTAAKSSKKPLIGFIGQGFVGKNYADDMERRGYATIRYALEEPYRSNKEKIKEADIVFVCVPTPTNPKGFDSSIVEAGVGLAGKGKIAVIKSTLLPGTTERVQKKYPDRIVLCSPEFLSVATAAWDAAHPFSNIVGLPVDNAKYRAAAEKVHSVLPQVPFSVTTKSVEAEIIKYAHNGSGYVQVILFNIMYDLAEKMGADWDVIQRAIEADPMVSNRYAKPLHKSGRGAGGFCFIKDFAALRTLYEKNLPHDTVGSAALRAIEHKNIDLLLQTNKDIELLQGVYGPGVVTHHAHKGKSRR
ncbi:MAG: hypothetical protein NUV88_00320 [Candidatus Kaiserbacteria bacterium]|nr:hypothetical protein [Candidatus Kaiserbacteria bacterium]